MNSKKGKKNAKKTPTRARGSRRLTMKDVAVEAGVHQTTVSLSLRNHPSIPEQTRERIRKIADRLGYRPDPALDAFNFHRLANHPIRSAPSMAFLSDVPSQADFEASGSLRELYRGAKTQAESMGYVLERFLIGPRQLSPSRLMKILESRNIGCVIAAAFASSTTELPLDWHRLCGIKIESFHVVPRLDIIAANYRQASRLAISRLQLLGYQRIGIALSRDDDSRLINLFRIGHLVEYAETEPQMEIPPFYLDDEPLADRAAAIENWISSCKIDAVISPDNTLPDLLRKTRFPVPDTIGFASLNLPVADLSLAGITTNQRLVGARAVELLSIQLHTNQRGVPDYPSITYNPIDWRDGVSAPLKSRAVGV